MVDVRRRRRLRVARRVLPAGPAAARPPAIASHRVAPSRLTAGSDTGQAARACYAGSAPSQDARRRSPIASTFAGGTMAVRLARLLFTLVSTCALCAVAHAQTLRIGLAEDPDVLDPTRARTFVGGIVFSALCDKLV